MIVYQIYDFADELGEVFDIEFKKVVKECEMLAKIEAEKEVRSDVSQSLLVGQ